MGFMALGFLTAATDQSGMVVMRRTLNSQTMNGRTTYDIVPTTATVDPTTFPLPNGKITFSTSAGAECRQFPADLPVDPARCDGVKTPAKAISISIPAAGNASVRTIVFDPASLTAAARTIANPAAACGTNITVNGQSWRLSCDPADIKGSFLKAPSIATPVAASLPIGDGITFDTSVAGVKCLDAITGVDVSAASCAGSPTPPTIGRVVVQAKVQPLLRRVLIDPSAIRAFAPTVTNVDSLCARSPVSIGGQAWEIVCTADALRYHYEKRPTTVTLINPTGGVAASGTAANYAGSLTFSTRTGVSCIDTDDGSIAPASMCAYAPDPASVGQFSVPATYSPAFRTVSFDKAALAAVAPAVAPDKVASQCAVSFDRVPDSGVRELWQTSCDPASISGQYVKVGRSVTVTGVSTQPSATIGKPRFNDTLSISTLVGFLCRDLKTGQAATDATKCQYLPNNASVGQFGIPVTGDPNFRTFLINPQDVLARAPEVTNIASLCSGSVTVPVTNGTSEVWKLSCTPDDIAGSFRKVATTASLVTYPYSRNGGYSTGTPDYADALSMSTLTGAQCVNADTGLEANSAKCLYVPNPPSVAQFTIPMTVSARFRLVVIDPADILKFAPTVTNARALCGLTFNFNLFIGYGNEVWKFTCDRSDIAGTFARYGKSVYVTGDPSTSGYALNGVANYAAVSQVSTLLNYGCRNTDTSQDADLAKCAYVPNPTSVAAFAVPVTVSAQTRKVLIDYRDVLKIAPEASDAQALCTRKFSMYTSYSGSDPGWSYTCDPADVRVHYARYAKSVYMTRDPETGGYALSGDANYVTSVSASTLLNYGCRDMDNGQDAAVSNCTYSANPASMASFSLAATVSAQTKKVLIDYREVLKVAPEVVDAQALCTRKFSMYTRFSGSDPGWSYTCNPDDVRVHYVRYGKSVYVTRDPESGGYAYAGEANFGTAISVSTLLKYGCRDTDNGQDADAANCALSANPSSVISTNIPVTVSPQTKKVLIDYQAVLKFAPEVTDAQALCTRTFSMYTRFSGSDAGWSYTCNPEDVRTHYVRFAKSVYVTRDPESQYYAYTSEADLAGSSVVSTLLNYGCRDTDTGQEVATSKCVYTANTSSMSSFSIAGTVSPRTRKVLIDYRDVLKIAPEVSDAQAICNRTFSMYTRYAGSDAGWSYTCNASDIRQHYARYGKAATITGVNSSVQPTTGRDNFASVIGASTLVGYGCRDTDTGDAVATSLCVYMPNPSSVSSFNVPVTVSPQNRTILVDAAEFLKVAPDLTNPQSVCSGTIRMTVTNNTNYSGNWTYEDYQLTCDPERIRTHYVRYGKAVVVTGGLPSSVYGTAGSPDFASNVGISTLAGYGCRDTDTGQDAASLSSCAYSPNPSSVVSTSIPATVSPKTRKVLVRVEDALKIAPELTNPQSICTGTTLRSITNNSNYYGNWTTETYSYTCNPADIAFPYQVQAKSAAVQPMTVTGSTASTAGMADFASTATIVPTAGCWNPDNTGFVADSVCAYSGGTVASKTVSTTYRPSIKKAVMSKAALLAAFPYITNIDTVCSTAFGMRFSGTSSIESGWSTTCID